MKTQNLFNNSLKASALLLLATTMTHGLTSCDNDIDDMDRTSKEAPIEEAPVEGPHSLAFGQYDDLAVLLGTIAETDSTGQVINRYYGEPLEASDTTHLFIGVDELQEARDMFELWLAPDVITTEHADGSLTATLTDKKVRHQGTVSFKPATEEYHVAEVTTDIPNLHFSRITFLDNIAWPRQKNGARYCKFDIVKNVKLTEITEWLKDDDQRLNFVCIQGSANGVKPVFCAVTRTRYVSPNKKHYSYMISKSRYTPGTGTFPTAANIQQMLLKDWSAYTEVFKEALCGPMIGGTEYWYDDEHWTFIFRYFGVMDYHCGNTYGEDGGKEYYFLLRLYGLDESKICDGMSF